MASRTRVTSIWIICASAICLAGCATANRAFPPDIVDNIWINLSRFGEPPIFISDRNRAYSSRYRLSITGVSCLQGFIRIDEKPGERFFGRVSYSSKCNHYRIASVDRSFRISRTQMAELYGVIETAKMWKFEREHWSVDNQDGMICLDGNEMYFERWNPEGYRISAANAQCEAPERLLNVAEKFVDLARADALKKLIGY